MHKGLSRKILILKYFISFISLRGISIGILILLLTSVYTQKSRLASLLLTNIFQTEVFVEEAQINISFEYFPLSILTLHNVIIYGTDPQIREKAAFVEKAYVKIHPLHFFFAQGAAPKKIQSIQIKNAKFNFKINENWIPNYQFFKRKNINPSKPTKELIIDTLAIQNSILAFASVPKKSKIQLYIQQSKFKIHNKKENTLLTILANGYTQGYSTPKFSLLYNKPYSLALSLNYHKRSKTLIFLPTSTLNLVGTNIIIQGKYKSLPRRKEYDLKLSSHSGNLQTLVSLLPSHIEELLMNYHSKGNLTLWGYVQGVYDSLQNPNFKLNFECKKVGIKNLKTQGKIENFFLKGYYTNGNNNSLATTTLSIEYFQGEIAQNLFHGKFSIYDFNQILIKCMLKGKLDIAELFRLAGISLESSASGIAQVDISFQGPFKNLANTNAIDKFHYDGYIHLDSINLKPENWPIAISHGLGRLQFQNNDILIEKIQGAINNQNFLCKGKIHQIIPYLIGKKATLEVQLNVQASNWYIDDFLETLKKMKSLPKKRRKKRKIPQKEKNQEFHLPDSLSLNIQLRAQHCTYRNLTFDHITAHILLQNRILQIKNLFMTNPSEMVLAQLTWDETKYFQPTLFLQLKTASNDLEKLFTNLEINSSTYTNSSSSPLQLQGEIEIKGKFEPHWKKNKLQKATLELHFKNWEIQKVKSKLNIRNLNFRVNLNENHLQNFKNTPFLIDSISGKIKNYSFSAAIHIDNWIDQNVKAELHSQISIPLFLSYFSLPMIEAHKGLVKMNIALAGKLRHFTQSDSILYTPQKGKVILEDLSFSFKERNLPFENIHAEIYFDSKGVNLHSFTGWMDGSPFEIRGTLTNLLPYLYLKKEMLYAKLFFSTHFVNIRNILSKNRKKPEAGFQLWLPAQANLVARAHIKKAYFDSLTFHNIQLLANLKNQIVEIESLETEFCKGTATISGKIDASKTDSIHLYTQIQFHKIEIKELFRGLNNFNQDFLTADEISGLFSAQVRLTDKVPYTLKNDFSQTQMHFNFAIEEGNLQNFETLMKLRGLLRKKYLEQVPFTIVGKNLFFHNKTLHIPEIILHSSIAQLHIQGVHGSYVDYKIDIIYSHKFEKEDFRKTLLTFRLHGSKRPYKLQYDARKAIHNLINRFKLKPQSTIN
ncbi:MAG: hypothetical protein NZ576_02575 [Bacteroidia bacterium]|nr:hypothetical protein [Bacteroidia bacterium]